MKSQFVPVELDNIEQGDFIREVKKAFAKLQQDFVAFVEEHQVSTKASLNVGVDIRFKKTSERSDKLAGNYGIVTKIVPNLPNKPSGVTTAYVAENNDGKRTLFTQSGGTTKDNPRQAHLQEPSGQTI